MKSKLLAIVLISSLLVVAFLSACSEDVDEPRDPSGTETSNAGHSTGNGGEGDVTDDTDTDGDADAGDEICELAPPLPGNEATPCCFTDDDCAESDAPDAALMRCYHAECTDGGAGTCYVPPVDDDRCFADDECAAGEECLFNPDDFRCEDPSDVPVADFCTGN